MTKKKLMEFKNKIQLKNQPCHCCFDKRVSFLHVSPNQSDGLTRHSTFPKLIFLIWYWSIYIRDYQNACVLIPSKLLCNHIFLATYLATICLTWLIILSSRKSYGNLFVHSANNATNDSKDSLSGTADSSLPSSSWGRINNREHNRNEKMKSYGESEIFH